MPLSRRIALLVLTSALFGLAGVSDDACAKNGGGGGSGSGGGGDSDGGGDSSGKGGGDDGGDDHGDDNSGKGKHGDKERAKDAVRQGAARPLPEILTAVSSQYPGKVIDVRLKRRSNILMYDVKVITPEGKLIRVRVNAASGLIVGTKGI